MFIVGMLLSLPNTLIFALLLGLTQFKTGEIILSTITFYCLFYFLAAVDLQLPVFVHKGLQVSF